MPCAAALPLDPSGQVLGKTECFGCFTQHKVAWPKHNVALDRFKVLICLCLGDIHFKAYPRTAGNSRSKELSM